MVSLFLHLSKKHRLTQNVYCKDDGMYQACCSGYVRQTKAAFSQCWAKHKALLNKFCYTENNDYCTYVDITTTAIKQFLLARLI